MSQLIDKIRSWFCKHEWECISSNDVYKYEEDKYPIYHKWIYICKKCGRKRKITNR